jgi:ring-1,2-phenylacetyl-CoA epoxidase subunit PaaE
MEQRIRLQVRALSFPVADTLLVQFEPMEAAYAAGQHLTLLLQPGRNEIRRSYSLCSLPTDPYPAIAITRVANGEASRWLHEKLEVGQWLDSLAPSGRFLLEAAPELVFLAAGSGITPIFPLIRQALLTTNSHLQLYYAEKTPDTTLFYPELLDLQAQYPKRFTLHWHFSQVVNRQTHFSGRLNQYVLEKAFAQQPNKQNFRFYACGPHSFLRLVRLSLQFMGFADGQIKRENFASEGIPLAGQTPEQAEMEVAVQIGGKQFRQSNRLTVLQGAKKAGIHLPYSCENGQCGTCTLRLQTGEVTHRLNEVLTDKELAEGYFLSCTAFPKSPEITI